MDPPSAPVLIFKSGWRRRGGFKSRLPAPPLVFLLPGSFVPGTYSLLGVHRGFLLASGSQHQYILPSVLPYRNRPPQVWRREEDEEKNSPCAPPVVLTFYSRSAVKRFLPAVKKKFVDVWKLSLGRFFSPESGARRLAATPGLSGGVVRVFAGFFLPEQLHRAADSRRTRRVSMRKLGGAESLR